MPKVEAKNSNKTVKIEIIYNPDAVKYKQKIKLISEDGNSICIPIKVSLSPEKSIEKIKEILDIDSIEFNVKVKEIVSYPNTDWIKVNPNPYTAPVIPYKYPEIWSKENPIKSEDIISFSNGTVTLKSSAVPCSETK